MPATHAPIGAVALSDTDAATRARHLAMISGVPKSERFLRAMALSSFVRTLTWVGATRSASGKGSDAAAERFLLQLYGSELPKDLRRRLVAGG